MVMVCEPSIEARYNSTRYESVLTCWLNTLTVIAWVFYVCLSLNLTAVSWSTKVWVNPGSRKATILLPLHPFLPLKLQTRVCKITAFVFVPVLMDAEQESSFSGEGLYL